MMDGTASCQIVGRLYSEAASVSSNVVIARCNCCLYPHSSIAERASSFCCAVYLRYRRIAVSTRHLDARGYEVATEIGPDLMSEIVDVPNWTVSFFSDRLLR